MADSHLQISIDQTDPLNASGRTGKELLNRVINHLQGIRGSSKRASVMKVWADGSAPRVARAVVTFATSSGAVGAVINGVTITITWAGSDAASQTLFAAAVNASSDALVQYLVQACNFAGTITLATVLAGDYIDIYGYRFTAKSGSSLEPDQFDMSGTDTQDAASLVTQINNRRGLNQIGVASSSAGVVTFRQFSGTAASGAIVSPAATFTISAPAARASTLISSLVPGTIGNAQSIAASGTNVSIDGGLTRLASGAGGNVALTNITL